MIIRALVFSTVFFRFAVVALAQNPLTTAPQAYKLQFENEWVQVTRVHYGPYEKIAAHDHSRWPAAYVYLNDGGPIIFKHVGWDDHPNLTRPATKAGSFRLSPTLAIKETHEVENPAGIPSDFLRVEFKTQPDNKKSLRGRFYRENYSADENFSKVQFENEQIRATRLVCAPHKSLEVTASSTEPALIIYLSAAHLQLNGLEGKARQMTFELGQTMWLAGGRQERFKNISGEPIELLRFDLRTAPANSKKGNKQGGEVKRKV